LNFGRDKSGPKTYKNHYRSNRASAAMASTQRDNHRRDRRLTERRPRGFQRYIVEQGFHGLYLVTTERRGPLKVGIASDPVARFANLQNAHFEPLRLYRLWWLPGYPISSRIERAFKEQFAPDLIRGEWFDVSTRKAEAFIEASIRSIGTWALGQEGMVERMEQWERRRFPPLDRLSPDRPRPVR
jgi:hypothetical protein